jgi:uncharacterized protein (TIGR02147 family)
VNIYLYNDYKKYLNALGSEVGSEQREVGSEQSKSWGFKTRMARAASCQKAYLSRVLNGDADLTHDQAFGISKFLQLDPMESDYFQLLVAHAKAGTAAYRTHLQAKLDAISQRMNQISGRLEQKTNAPQPNTGLYYSSWIWSAIHIQCGCTGKNKASTIAEKLKLPLGLVQEVLEQLEAMGLISRNQDSWEIRQYDVHIDHKQLALIPYHHSWRQKAMERQILQNPDDLFYTSVQSINPSDLPALRSHMLEAIQSFRNKVVASAPEKTLVVLNCDFFPLYSRQDVAD